MRSITIPYIPNIADFLNSDKFSDRHKAYAVEQYHKLIDIDCEAVLRKIGISPFDLIYIDDKALPQQLFDKFHTLPPKEEVCCFLLSQLLQNKRLYVSFPHYDKDDFFLNSPELVDVFFEYQNIPMTDSFYQKLVGKYNKSKNNAFTMLFYGRKVRKKFSYLELKSVCRYLKAAMSERMFIARYNEEKFFLGVEYCDQLVYFSSKSVINLEEKAVVTALCVLYGLTFGELSTKDFYTASSIFSFDSERRKQELLTRIGVDFYRLIRTSDERAIAEAYVKMGRKLEEIELPKAYLYDAKTLRENYTVYAGISAIGAAYAKAISGRPDFFGLLNKLSENKFHEIKLTSKRLACYKVLAETVDEFVKRCELIKEGQKKLPHIQSIGKGLAFTKVVRGKTKAKELDFKISDFL